MTRIDQSNFLIHFTKGKIIKSSAEAYKCFMKIFVDGKLNGGNYMIKGNFRCICFIESPIGCLIQDINEPKKDLEKKYFDRYSPFGFHFPKNYIHTNGGRHVIYSTESEYANLPSSLKWRFVRYEPNSKEKSIDFTWEREWRIKEELIINQSQVKLVFPNRIWIDKFIKDYESSLNHNNTNVKSTTIVLST